MTVGAAVLRVRCATPSRRSAARADALRALHGRAPVRLSRGRRGGAGADRAARRRARQRVRTLHYGIRALDELSRRMRAAATAGTRPRTLAVAGIAPSRDHPLYPAVLRDAHLLAGLWPPLDADGRAHMANHNSRHDLQRDERCALAGPYPPSEWPVGARRGGAPAPGTALRARAARRRAPRCRAARAAPATAAVATASATSSASALPRASRTDRHGRPRRKNRITDEGSSDNRIAAHASPPRARRRPPQRRAVGLHGGRWPGGGGVALPSH